MCSPRITVGMPVYNGENYIEAAIDSILAQDFEDFELIISDNCSTDGTEQICRSYARKDQRIQYHRSDTNRGASWNHNRLVEMARGEFFRWAAHDDVLAPSNLRRCVETLEQSGKDVVLCYPKTVLIDENGRRMGLYDDCMHSTSPCPHERFRLVLNNLRQVNPVFGLIRLDALKKTHLMGAFSGSDAVFILELSLFGRFVEIPEYLWYRRRHPSMCSLIPDLEDRATWTDPANSNKTRNRLFILTLFYETLKVIKQSPLSAVDKRRCYAITVSHWLTRKWKPIAGDILRYARVMPLLSLLAARPRRESRPQNAYLIVASPSVAARRREEARKRGE